MKAGTINKFPEYIGTKYVGLRPPYLKNVVNKSGRIYGPPQREKTVPNYSVVNYNIDRCIQLEACYTDCKTFLFLKRCFKD